MTIFLDNIIYSLQAAGGISAYWYELSKRWLETTEEVYFLEKKTTSNIFRDKLLIPNQLLISDNKLPIIFDRYLPANFTYSGRTIFHSSYYRTTTNSSALSIVTVHDFTYEKMNWGIRKKIHQHQKKIALDNADGIICVSENTKKDLLTFYPYLSKKPITVIYNGVSDLFFPLNANEKYLEDNFAAELAGKQYVLFVGSREGYKNFTFAIQLLAYLKNYTLVIVGGGPLNKNEKLELKQSLGDNWQHYLGVETERLNILYNFAQFLIYPSLYEGFGIPVIEAERAGCPVIALNASSIPEIAGNSELLLSTADVHECLEKVSWLQENRSLIKSIGITNSKKFSWDTCFNKVKDFYNEILNS